MNLKLIKFLFYFIVLSTISFPIKADFSLGFASGVILSQTNESIKPSAHTGFQIESFPNAELTRQISETNNKFGLEMRKAIDKYNDLFNDIYLCVIEKASKGQFHCRFRYGLFNTASNDLLKLRKTDKELNLLLLFFENKGYKISYNEEIFQNEKLYSNQFKISW